MRRCWTCKKRRLKCDGGVPSCQKCWGHGVECLGYKKPLTWVEGVARRGPMKNRTFGESQRQSLSISQWDGSSTSRGYYNTAQASILWLAGSLLPMTLTDPLFKDLGIIPRFFIDYFSKRVCSSLVFQDNAENPYRGIIPWIRSPMVATCIVTVAACHYFQGLTGSTLPGLPTPATDQAPPLITSKCDIAGLTTSERGLINYYLRLKELSLNLVSSHLTMHYSKARNNASVIAIVLLAVLDIFESGSGAWNVHLKGSKNLIEAGSINGCSVFDSSVETLLCEAATFQILGSSLAKPAALNSESTLPVTQIRTSSTVAPIGCPVAVLSAIETFALNRRANDVFALQMAHVEYLKDTLHRLRLYDIAAWAMDVTVNNSMVSSRDLMQLGTIWKLSAEIYARRVLFNLTGDTSILEPSLVDDVVAGYAFLEREDDDLLKCLIWPTFIAGAANINEQRRPWILKTLDRIWHIGHCANTRNAAMVLESLWKKHDLEFSKVMPLYYNPATAEDLSVDHNAYNWLLKLSLLDGSWLFI